VERIYPVGCSPESGVVFGARWYRGYFRGNVHTNDNHPEFNLKVAPNQKIWRYLDLAKFLSMIQTNCLFFTRIDLLGDPAEGKITQIDMDRMLEKHNALDAENILRDFKGAISANYINCWHANDSESAAMWSIYLQEDKGIAIQSRLDLLIDSLPQGDMRKVRIGQVDYIDRKTHSAGTHNGFSPILKKGKYYEYENEIRAVHWLAEQPTPQEIYDQILDGTFSLSPGVEFPCDLDLLIESIVLSPKSPKWFNNMVNNLLITYNHQDLAKKLRSSSMLETYF
jgi:hypothetical protein